MLTIQSHPLKIAPVQLGKDTGRNGILFGPDKIQTGSMSGTCGLNLRLDLDAISDWRLSLWSLWSRITGLQR
jgi:hypothetical protein